MVNVIPETEDQDFLETILIVTDDVSEIDVIKDFLRLKSFNVFVSEFDGRTLKNVPSNPPVAVLCRFDAHMASVEKIAQVLRNKFTPRNIPFIGALKSEDTNLDVFDTVIFPPAHPVQIANRVNSMVRLNIMQTEIALRIDTLKSEFDVEYSLSDMSFEDPFRVLFIGKATPEFMVIINALQNKNVEVVAAFTSFSAFDFLHEHTFDAVVMNTLKTIEPGLTISETMRRNSKLYHVPTLFLIGENFTEFDLAYEKGATDIISARCSEAQISGRILELANYHRIHRQLKIEFEKIGDESCRDIGSRTYNDEFFTAHLRQSCDYYHTQDAPLSVIKVNVSALDVEGVTGAELLKAYDQVGTIIKNMVRMQDTVGRLGSDSYAICFPGQSAQRIESVLERIKDVISCSAFDSRNALDNRFAVDVDLSLNAYQPDMNIETFIDEIVGSPTSTVANENHYSHPPMNENSPQESLEPTTFLAS